MTKTYPEGSSEVRHALETAQIEQVFGLGRPLLRKETDASGHSVVPCSRCGHPVQTRTLASAETLRTPVCLPCDRAAR